MAFSVIRGLVWTLRLRTTYLLNYNGLSSYLLLLYLSIKISDLASMDNIINFTKTFDVNNNIPTGYKIENIIE